MIVKGKHYRTIWLSKDGWSVNIINQVALPHKFIIEKLKTLKDAAEAISQMKVRGAPLIGVTAAYGICLALRKETSDTSISSAAEVLLRTRPTAVNLQWAVAKMLAFIKKIPESNHEERIRVAYSSASKICEKDVIACRKIGKYGLKLIRSIYRTNNKDTINILTHCNAGWLAAVDYGTALAPIYAAHEDGLPVHVWVDETRPRNQGASLTAWELGQQGIPHTVIVDNAGGHLMQKGEVDLCITGTDRTTSNGDVCNKIGTYLKALAAKDTNTPFYVALPGSTIDWSMKNGIKQVPIEERNSEEVTHIEGYAKDGSFSKVRLTPKKSFAANPAFDITPAKLVTALITDRGVCEAKRSSLRSLYKR